MAGLQSYGPWALVTGASAGIGTAFAQRLAVDGFNVALVARRAERLRTLADDLAARHRIETRVVPQDLAAPDAADRVAEAVRDLEVGLLVNNAGFSAVGRFDRVPRDKIVEMIQVNCIAVATLTHAFLPKMRARGRGGIIVLASVAGYQPLGLAATYGATKAFDLMLAEALWAETRGSGVDVLAVSPGPVETEFQAVAGETPHPGQTPESVVEESLAALGKKPSVVTGGLVMKARTWSVRLAPRAQVAQLALGVMRGFIPETLR